MTLYEEISNAYPGFEPDAKAHRASQTAITARLAATRRTQRIRRSVVVAAFTLSTVAVLVGLGPTALAVYNLHKIEGAVDDAKTAEIDEYTILPDGSQKLSGRELYNRGKWRMERGSSVAIWEAGKLWRMDPNLKRITVKSSPNGPAAYNPSGFSVRSMIADMARWNWRDRIDVGVGQFEGADVMKVTISNSNGAERLVVLANQKTSMPVAFEMESKTVHGWHMSGLARARFDHPLDAGLFSLHFDPTLPIVDLDKERSEFKDRIETPLVVYPWMHKAIAIRVVDVNPNGHIFVLYTDGETVTDRHRESGEMLSASQNNIRSFHPHFMSIHPSIEVTSSLGGEYLKTGNLQPYVDGPSERFRSGIILRDGEVLQGAWFVPAKSTPWQPLTVNVRFNADQSKVYRRHFSTASTPLLPDWTPLMGIAPTVDDDVLREELSVRRSALIQGPDAKALIANIEGELALRRKEESQGIGPWAEGDLYFALYQAYLKLGDHPTAVSYLRKAANEPYPAPGLQQALAKENVR